MVYVPRLSKASAHREVAERYARMARRRAGTVPKSRTMAAARISELTRLFDDLWGQARIEESDTGYQAARVMAHHIGKLRQAPRRISDWLQHCASWMGMAERERLISEVDECPLKWTADKLAWKFKVTLEQRTRLKLTTVGAIDLPKAERIKRRARAKRDRMAANRQAQGAMSRAEYRKAVKSAAPWIEQGISRASWYRRKRET